ncbi:MAG: hypothetical protein ACI87E_002452 [Mariniblastus sp.]|jgi:hypothetical protein
MDYFNLIESIGKISSSETGVIFRNCFRGGVRQMIPSPAMPPKAVWINPPIKRLETKNGAPKANCPGAPKDTSLTHPRSGYPSARCVPAEPASVSLDSTNVR